MKKKFLKIAISFGLIFSMLVGYIPTGMAATQTQPLTPCMA